MARTHWSEVEGLRMPALIGGHPALDFCNTWAGWGEPPAPDHDWLRSYSHLAVWTYHAGLTDRATMEALRRLGARRPAQAATALTTARRLRTAG